MINERNKRTKSTKNFIIKQKLEFEGCKHCLEATQSENKMWIAIEKIIEN